MQSTQLCIHCQMQAHPHLFQLHIAVPSVRCVTPTFAVSRVEMPWHKEGLATNSRLAVVDVLHNGCAAVLSRQVYLRDAHKHWLFPIPLHHTQIGIPCFPSCSMLQRVMIQTSLVLDPTSSVDESTAWSMIVRRNSLLAEQASNMYMQASSMVGLSSLPGNSHFRCTRLPCL